MHADSLYIRLEAADTATAFFKMETTQSMATSSHEDRQMSKDFNFAIDVVDYWAENHPNLQAMHWVSQDESDARHLSFKYFSDQSHRIALLLKQLGLNQGDSVMTVLPRVPAWSVYVRSIGLNLN